MRHSPLPAAPGAHFTYSWVGDRHRDRLRSAWLSRLLIGASLALAGVAPVQAAAQAGAGQGGRQLLLSVPPLIAALAASGPETTTYTYDAKGRLVMVLRDGAVTDVTTAYRYDRADNRTRLTTTGSPNPPQP